MSKQIPDLDVATKLEAEDQFIFYQNSTQKTKRVSRNNMLNTPGFTTSIPNLPGGDAIAPNAPAGLILTSSSSLRSDGTEDIIITAKITPNIDSDLEGYSWYIRQIDGTPTFSGGSLISGGVLAAQSQTPTYEKSAKNVENIGGSNYAVKVFRGVRANQWYLVKVAAVDKSGNYSSYTSDTLQTGYILTTIDSTPPGAPILNGEGHPTNPSKTAIKSVFLRWTNPSDSDLSRIDIYRSDGPSFSSYVKIGSASGTAWTDSSTSQGITYRYKLKAVDRSGNESGFSTISPDPGNLIDYLSITPGLVMATDITTFAVDATKINVNTIILKGALWTDNSSTKYISWNAHTVVYGGQSYDIQAGTTNLKYVYWLGSGTTYSTSDTNPTASLLGDHGFVIATNVGSDGNASGIHDLAWNGLANAVIGTAWIQNAAITNAKVSDLSADKITAGTIDSDIITLGEVGALSKGIIKSSGASSSTSGSGFWIEGGSNPIFAIGSLGAAPSMTFSGSSLIVKGRVESNSGFFGDSSLNGVLIDSKGLSIVGNSTATENMRLMANLEWNNSANAGLGGFTANSSGFYLGKAGTISGGASYKFFIGESGNNGTGGTNYLYWDGLGLKMAGNIVAGTTVGVTSDASFGLTIRSQFGIRKIDNNGSLILSGGGDNGTENGAQIDLCGVSLATYPGYLILQAGQAGASTILFNTNKSLDSTGKVGVTRMSIDSYGLVNVQQQKRYDGTYTAQSGNLQVDSNLGVGLAPDDLSDLNNGGPIGKIWCNNEIAVYASNSPVVKLLNTGEITASQFTSSSSRRFKTNIRKLKLGLDAVKKLKPVSFKKKGKNGKNDIGLIAEEVFEIAPMIIGRDSNGDISGLDYSKLVPILIQAVKELSAEVDKLKKKII